MPMESGADLTPEASAGGLELRLIGPLAVRRNGIDVALPASRKVRALLAYLAMAPAPVGRSDLCELLWEVPNDPRGELRWCLSKLRGLIDEPGRQRTQARRDAARLDLSDCFVDAHVVLRATERKLGSLPVDDLRGIAALFTGSFLEGLEIDRCPAFQAWLLAQRRRFQSCQAAVLERLAASAPAEEALSYLERLVGIAPFDRHAHELLLETLARRGRFKEGEAHTEATAKRFEAEGLEAAPLRATWRAAKAKADPVRIEARGQPALDQAASAPNAQPLAARRASIAVMPFVDTSPIVGPQGGVGSALAFDVIVRLAKLRSHTVIAQGTVRTLSERGIGTEEAGRILGVDYIVGGVLQSRGGRISVQVELIETRSARIVWAESYEPQSGGALALLEQIGDRIVSSVVAEIETAERNRAILKLPSSLDAWEAHHRGLWHMYRFTQADNLQARHLFELAVRLDPTYSRAYASLSFTYWQDAFQGWTGARQKTLDEAYAAASQGLMADDRDPAAHWAMGRAEWLKGRHDQSVAEFEQAVDLSPNFALAHYNLSFVHSTAGDATSAIRFADQSRSLSPFDPMLFGMLGARAMALVRLGRFEEAADWGVKAAARPNSFPHIRAIAAFSLALAERLDEARHQTARLLDEVPGYRFADFQRAFRFDARGTELFRKAALRVGVK